MGINVVYDQKLLKNICDKLLPRLVILYGSRSSGNPPPNEESDLDLAVLDRPGRLSYSRYSDFCRQLTQVFDSYNLDLVVLNNVDSLFRYEVVSQGKLLCGDEEDFLEYKAFAYKDYVDSWDLRNLEDALFKKQFEWIKNQLYASS